MAEYIKRGLVLETLERGAEHVSCIDECTEFSIRQCISVVKKIPAADVAPAVHGQWKTKRGNYITGGGNPLWCCSNCGYVVGASLLPPKYNHCPSCGAKMQEAQ